MKKISLGNLILGKCKSLSRQLSRSSSYTNLRSRSARADIWGDGEEPPADATADGVETIYVGSTKKRYVISSKFLKHPLLSALIDRSSSKDEKVIKCEVVLFDHLLWMLQNSDPNLVMDSLDELTHLYQF